MQIETLKVFHHWQKEYDDAGIIWLSLNRSDSSTNILSKEVLQEFKSLLEDLKKDKAKGLVIQSGKKNGFIAGADIQQFKKITSEEEAFAMAREGQTLFTQLEELPFPTLALIEGFCLGGGLELALACRYRVAIDSPQTKLGLPEVLLGIHPGWGGSIRLPRLIGVFKAMSLILTGKTVDAKMAYKMGLLDAAVPIRYARSASRYFLLKEPKRRRSLNLDVFSHYKYVRKILGAFLQKRLEKRVKRAHYPAPFAALDLWVEEGVESQEAYIAEANSLAKLITTETARNLVYVFDLQEKLKNLGKHLFYKPKQIHVVGSGVMGGDIAAFCAMKGYKVTLQDQDNFAIARALKRGALLFKKYLKEDFRVKKAMDHLIPDTEGVGIIKADLIIEAIVEKQEAKTALFSTLDEKTNKETILASNTSTIPLNVLSNTSQHKERILGLHFFNPVAKMPLVEVVVDETDPENVQKAIAFVRSIDKLPLPVKSSPGFLVNRILMPYLLESILLLEEGVPAQLIDKEATDFGMPMGPLELADTVGLDVCLYGGESLQRYYGGHLPSILQKLVSQGHLGKKTGQGFYKYKNAKPIKEKIDKHYRGPEDILDRLILRMLNEAVACLREQIVSDKAFIDAGMVFGVGFPAFRGGPMHYIAEQGEALLLQRLNLLAQRYGDRFVADPGWH